MAIDINELDIPVRLKGLDQVKRDLGGLGQQGASSARQVEAAYTQASASTSRFTVATSGLATATAGADAQSRRFLMATGRLQVMMAGAATGFRDTTSLITGMTAGLGALGPQIAVIAGAVGVAALVWKRYAESVEDAVEATIEAGRRFNDVGSRAAGGVVRPDEGSEGFRRRAALLRQRAEEWRDVAEAAARAETAERRAESYHVRDDAGQVSVIRDEQAIAHNERLAEDRRRAFERVDQMLRFAAQAEQNYSTTIRNQSRDHAGSTERIRERMRAMQGLVDILRYRAGLSDRDVIYAGVDNSEVDAVKRAHQAYRTYVNDRDRMIRESIAQQQEAEKRLAEERMRAIEEERRAKETLLAERNVAQMKERDTPSGLGQFFGAGKGGPSFNPLDLIGGQFNNVMAGMVSGITQAINPVGLLTNAVTSFAGSLFGVSEAERAARIEQQRWLDAIKAFGEEVRGVATDLGYAWEITRTGVSQGGFGGTVTKVEIRRMTPLEQALAQLEEQFEELRRRGVEAGLATSVVNQQIALLQAAEEARIRAEFASRQRELQEDYTVRLLVAQGMDAQADAMRLALEHQRELEQAIRDGADAATIAALTQTQLAEKERQRADQQRRLLEDQMDALRSQAQRSRATATNLQDYLGTLPYIGASPAQTLAGTRGEFNRLMDLARAGDQDAANKIPQAAQSFLEASRQYNASSMAFQRDLRTVMDSVGGLAGIFADQATFEEQQLAKLQEQIDLLKVIKDKDPVINIQPPAWPEPPEWPDYPGWPKFPNTPFVPALPPVNMPLAPFPDHYPSPVLLPLEKVAAASTASLAQHENSVRELKAAVSVLQDGFKKTIATQETGFSELRDELQRIRRSVGA